MVTVLGSVDGSTATSAYDDLDMDGFYFVGTFEAVRRLMDSADSSVRRLMGCYSHDDCMGADIFCSMSYNCEICEECWGPSAGMDGTCGTCYMEGWCDSHDDCGDDEFCPYMSGWNFCENCDYCDDGDCGHCQMCESYCFSEWGWMYPECEGCEGVGTGGCYGHSDCGDSEFCTMYNMCSDCTGCGWDSYSN